MAQTFKCADIGMQCGFQATAPTKEELLVRIGMHANEVHQMKEIEPSVLKAINNAIKKA